MATYHPANALPPFEIITGLRSRAIAKETIKENHSKIAVPILWLNRSQRDENFAVQKKKQAPKTARVIMAEGGAVTIAKKEATTNGGK
jgi:hypothetical protein